jgi:3-keto steroid reductase
MALEVLKKGPRYAFSHDKAYMPEEVGRLSRDRRRGAIWGINTFATYLLVGSTSTPSLADMLTRSQANELLPLLQQSPASLPFSPRVVYTTSSTAELSDFDMFDRADTQLRTARTVYAPSKYAGDLLINDFDRKHGEPSGGNKPKGVRALAAEPACVATNAAKDYILDSPFFAFLQFANWLVFALVSCDRSARSRR